MNNHLTVLPYSFFQNRFNGYGEVSFSDSDYHCPGDEAIEMKEFRAARCNIPDADEALLATQQRGK